ncbi:hypothetical protein CC1_20780 [Coprococcus catus GD/7]|uniref:Uncharacterized protein n=1 Tax=Coprococcus catus GD/7 TaxID=717962 RepID=D4J8X5_9FIRM|nr:hypothetical protein CC1_20780 [Coprococcus catus GD/7]
MKSQKPIKKTFVLNIKELNSIKRRPGNKSRSFVKKINIFSPYEGPTLSVYEGLSVLNITVVYFVQ